LELRRRLVFAADAQRCGAAVAGRGCGLIQAADLFCGAGGTSTGLAQAAALVGRPVDLLAVNHWPTAVETHQKNHPWARHMCESLESVKPRDVVPGERLNLLVASPECTHHSNARGGTPMSDQSRASAWHVLRWANDLYIKNVLVENVREFANWGPLGATRRPLASKRGETFYSWLKALESLGYSVDYRVLNAADYGGATTRERLFVQARRGKRIVWPEPTHRPPGPEMQRELFECGVKPWRPAREIIDWSLRGESIFRRRKPLAAATMARIAAGLRRFGGKNAEPFLVVLRNHQHSRSLNQPLPTVTTSGAHFGLCQPFIVPQFGESTPRSIDQPLGTITTTSRGIGLCEPFIVTASHGDSGGTRSRRIGEPLPTVTGSNDHALVEPFIMPLNHGKNDNRAYSMDRPLPTVTSIDAWSMVEPFLVKYNGTGGANPVSEPIDTITAKDRFGLVECDGYLLDIRFRMLQWHELAAAMGFPPEYWFAGNREQKVKQIGNSVEVNQARALCSEMLV
jgi:DNA (cytosine-5)-methyltransferase 1